MESSALIEGSDGTTDVRRRSLSAASRAGLQRSDVVLDVGHSGSAGKPGRRSASTSHRRSLLEPPVECSLFATKRHMHVSKRSLFNHLVGACEQGWWYVKAKASRMSGS